MSEQRILMNGNDVISLNNHDDKTWIGHHTFKTEEFLNNLSHKVDGNREKQKRWITEGVDCTVLTPNQGWQKGKIRLSVEFVPDSVESPLHEIRQGLG
ncbi:MAG: hypothetical protein N5P05_000425 [Chroococcopsis gigantea SAG 12.99]|jgi:hypothetical protein|nr:hypothetical protein [Chroococcopsis gigantea SAG 12.99]